MQTQAGPRMDGECSLSTGWEPRFPGLHKCTWRQRQLGGVRSGRDESQTSGKQLAFFQVAQW